jgi:hypothetical protein
VIAPLFAVTPLVLGPLAVLAMLFPALFAGPLRALRRWWVFFNVCTVTSALYIARFTFLGVKRRLSQSDAWWASPLAFWLVLALVAAAGALWVWQRHRAASPAAPRPGGGEQVVLGLVSLIGLGLVGYSLWGGGPRPFPVLLIWTVPLVGWGYSLYLHRHSRRQPAANPLFPTQGVMLITLALVYSLYGVATVYSRGDGDVLNSWLPFAFLVRSP